MLAHTHRRRSRASPLTAAPLFRATRAHRWPALRKVVQWPESRKRLQCRVSYSHRRATNNLSLPCNRVLLTILFIYRRCFWSCQIMPNQDSWGKVGKVFGKMGYSWNEWSLFWRTSWNWKGGSCSHVKLGEVTVSNYKQTTGEVETKTCQNVITWWWSVFLDFLFTFQILSCWWFEPLWKILANWDDYSQYMGK